VLPATGTLQNSQCTVSLSGANISFNGTAVSLQLSLAFAPGFAGAKTIHALAINRGGVSSPWQTMGTWTVPAH